MIGIVWGATTIKANEKLETIIEYYKHLSIGLPLGIIN